MQQFSLDEIRILTKLVQLLKKDHDIHLQLQQTDLLPSLNIIVEKVADPVIQALWQSLADKVDWQPSASNEESPKQPPSEKETSPKGRYIVYRGNKQWVDH